MRYLLVAFLSLSLAHCGRNVPQTPVAKTSAPGPVTGQPNPSTGGNPPPKALKWTEQELKENSEICADAGSSDYSYESWLTFCRCAYEGAASSWTLNYFYQNFETCFQKLSDDGVIDQCLKKADITLQ